MGISENKRHIVKPIGVSITEKEAGMASGTINAPYQIL
jgi:hypothetical protein